MTATFVDTFFLLALVNTEDDAHGLAMEFRHRYRGPLLTTEYVLLEVLDALIVGEARQLGIAIVSAVRSDRNITVVPCSSDLLSRAMALFAERNDKTWGITDCISFVVMREKGITQALTADHHFEQAGFRALLR